MNPIKAAGLESTDQKLKKIGGPKKKGSLKNNIGKHKTHMSHSYICNNGFFYIYICVHIYIFLSTFFVYQPFFGQKLLGETMVRPNKTKSPQMPRFQVSHKVQSSFLIKHKYLQPQLAYPKLSNVFLDRDKFRMTQEQPSTISPKKKSQGQGTKLFRPSVSDTCSCHVVPILSSLGFMNCQGKGRTNPSHQLPCTTGFPAFPPM